jgi:hypothetical protein
LALFLSRRDRVLAHPRDAPGRRYQPGGVVTTRTDVLELMRQSGPLTPRQVATRLALSYERTKKAMQRMAKAGELHTDGTGSYSLPVPSDTNQRDTRTAPRILVLQEHWEDAPPAPRLRRRWDWR